MTSREFAGVRLASAVTILQPKGSTVARTSSNGRRFYRPKHSFGTLRSPPCSNHPAMAPLFQSRFSRLRPLLSMALLMLPAVAGCNVREPVPDSAPITATAKKTSSPAAAIRKSGASETPAGVLELRLAAIHGAVRRWRQASDLRVAHAAAEEARNLIVGAAGPYYGDSDRDGSVAGASSSGLLPGRLGEAGLAQPGDGACVVRDILGGSWEQPARRWSILETAIEAWSPSRNTFPSLPSHPQRIIGWATLTLSSRQLATAREYGEHARLHIDISRAALVACEL